jgi:porphyrinogen peroxidase
MNTVPQPGISAAIPTEAVYLTLSRLPSATPASSRKAVTHICERLNLSTHVVGLGAALCNFLGVPVPGLRTFAQFATAKIDLPIHQSDIWIWFRGNDRGELFQQARLVAQDLSKSFEVDALVNAFRHKKGHDLTGFEDGTENPKGRAASKAAFVQEGPLSGSSFVAVQLWEHHLNQFDAMTDKARNFAIGRNLHTNEELENAPESAHVKRTAQESFSPEAFVLRRSMPWTDGVRAGLMFVAFGHSFDAFEAQLARMSGADDGIVDGLFAFSRPLAGAYYWCPPLSGASDKPAGLQWNPSQT